MTTARVQDEVRKPAMKLRRIAGADRKVRSFEASVLRYAAGRNLPEVPSLLKAASGTRLSPHAVIRRCTILSSRAFVRSKPIESTNKR